MALRDSLLNDKIIAASKEVSEKGFTGASLRKLAERTGATVGALQTRYSSKDELFVSLIKPFLCEMRFFGGSPIIIPVQKGISRL